MIQLIKEIKSSFRFKKIDLKSFISVSFKQNEYHLKKTKKT